MVRFRVRAKEQEAHSFARRLESKVSRQVSSPAILFKRFGGQPKNIPVQGPCQCVPKLIGIVVHVVKSRMQRLLAWRAKAPHDLVLTIGAPRHVEGCWYRAGTIEQARGNGHLVVILVNPLARKGLGQWGNLVKELGERVEPLANLSLVLRSHW